MLEQINETQENYCAPKAVLNEQQTLQQERQIGEQDRKQKTIEFSTEGRYDPAPIHCKCTVIDRNIPEGHSQSLCHGTENKLLSSGKDLACNGHELPDNFCAKESIENAKDSHVLPFDQLKDNMENTQGPGHMPEYDPKIVSQFDHGARLIDKVPCFCPGRSPRDAAYETPPPQELQTQSVGVKAALHSTPEPCEDAGRKVSYSLDPIEMITAKPSKKAAPCYLSQLHEMFPKPNGNEPRMGVIGPWATGVVEWGPTSGITGVRPVADQYSITKYSEGDWRQRNADVLKGVNDEIQHACNVDFSARECAKLTAANNDRRQHNTTKKISVRTHEVHHWKTELERAINLMAEELNLMEIMRQKLKNAMGVCRMPESIADECLTLRTGRLEPDLIKDQVEMELLKERALVNEVHDLMEKMLKELEEQQRRDKTAKSILEMDWSDKKEAYELEKLVVNLRISSPNIMWKPGSVHFSEGQPTPKSWEHATKQNLNLLEMERSRSIELRHFLESFTDDISRDLLMQANRVDAALAYRIADTDAARQSFEDELIRTLQRIVDTEKLIVDLKIALRNQDISIKKAQTRMASRALRPRTENCRDEPQFGLIAEVESIEENVVAVKSQLRHAEESLAGLLTARGDLEREIMVKRKSLMIDRDRLQKIRSHYPASVSLSGY